MTHEQAREALEALALDALDASERDAVMAHVATCTTCQRELAALENTANELAYAATPLAMPPAQRDRIRARLLARAAADRGAGDPLATMAPPLRIEPARAPTRADAASIRPAAPRRLAFGPVAWMATAASVIAILGVGAFVKASRERDVLREALVSARAANGTQLAALDSLRAAVASRDRMLANLTGPQVAVMTLASTGPTAPTGMMFWDQRHDAWTFVAHQVPMPRAGRTYQLWLVTPTAKISAGTFSPTPDGEVMMQATYALPKDSLAAVAVTDEPQGGSPEPTTQPFLVAAK
ncbi:MAG TPA: anti-sigma factor [Gemmatimonadaceae bacterium]|nr:anti-sigma factor [Gemmatimonadaceae bacterium]